MDVQLCYAYISLAEGSCITCDRKHLLLAHQSYVIIGGMAPATAGDLVQGPAFDHTVQVSQEARPLVLDLLPAQTYVDE